MKRSVSILILALLVAGCATNPTPTPVAPVPTQAPTWTPQPTYTPNPTYTPFPTPTILPPTAKPAPTTTPAPTATPTPVTYVVKPGDMLNSLAQQFNVAPEAIIAANNITNPNIIEVGSVLVIPLTVTGELPATAPISVTPQLVAARPVAPVAPRPAPANLVYSMPHILYPPNGTTLKYNSQDKKNGTDSIVLSWLPVGQLLGAEDKQPCSWQGQPNGTTGYLVDRYHIEFNPAVWNSQWQRSYPVFHNDHGTNREFNLLEFQPDVSYSWRVVVGRWCVLIDYDNQDPKHNVMLQLVSPYTEWRTFMYTR